MKTKQNLLVVVLIRKFLLQKFGQFSVQMLICLDEEDLIGLL